MSNGQGCSNVTIEEDVNFSIVVKVDMCKPEEEDNIYNFNIEVVLVPILLYISTLMSYSDFSSSTNAL